MSHYQHPTHGNSNTVIIINTTVHKRCGLVLFGFLAHPLVVSTLTNSTIHFCTQHSEFYVNCFFYVLQYFHYCTLKICISFLELYLLAVTFQCKRHNFKNKILRTFQLFHCKILSFLLLLLNVSYTNVYIWKKRYRYCCVINKTL